jgi:putative oxidoreductase
MTNLNSLAAPLGRVLLALIFIVSGLQKLGDPAGTAAYIASGGLPGILVWPTILVEVVGGVLLAAGYQTRFAALALAGFTLLSGVLYHLVPAGAAEGMAVQMQIIMFMKNVSIAGGLYFVFALGAGAWSVDARGQGASAAA